MSYEDIDILLKLHMMVFMIDINIRLATIASALAIEGESSIDEILKDLEKKKE